MGELRDHNYEQHHHRASGLNLVDLATAIRFLWDDVVEYPAGSGVSHEISVRSVSRLANGHFRLHGLGVPGRVYQVQASTSPDAAGFQAIGTTLTDASGTFSYEDEAAVGQTKRFYRLLLLPPN